MIKPEIFVSREEDAYKVKVVGRSTFAVAPAMRNLVQRIDSDSSTGVSIDLSECTGMDSTFMGILAMLALKIKNNKQSALIANANEDNKKLLDGLGLNKLFEYIETPADEQHNWEKEEEKDTSFKENAETVLQAHKTLMETDITNVDKFKNVVEQVEKELK